MPSLTDIKKNSVKRNFQKVNHRPWDENGEQNKNQLSTGVTNSESIASIDPKNIINWQYHDRPDSELGDLNAFAKELKEVGQQQPCIVRPLDNKQGKYELIAGERRWRAAKIAEINLQVIIKTLTDKEAALSQAAENENRKDLSDYAKGVSYSRLIEQGILKQKDLIEKLNKPKQYVSALLSFSKIPDKIIEAIGDMSLVSARTAETIKRLALKGDEYMDAIIEKAPAIAQGKIGHTTLERLIEKKLSSEVISHEKMNIKVSSPDGRHIYTWRKDNNSMPSIHFPKNVAELIENKSIDFERLSIDLRNVIENKLEELKKSAWADNQRKN